jgi:hypothetical protein
MSWSLPSCHPAGQTFFGQQRSSGPFIKALQPLEGGGLVEMVSHLCDSSGTHSSVSTEKERERERERGMGSLSVSCSRSWN